MTIRCGLHALSNNVPLIGLGLLMSCVSWVNPSYANEGPNESVNGLFLNPKSCVITKRHPYCDQKISVFWSLEKPLNVCLFLTPQNKQGLAACSSDRIIHNTTVWLNTQEDVAFELRVNNSDDVLYSELFKVYRAVLTRRKRRNPWSFY